MTSKTFKIFGYFLASAVLAMAGSGLVLAENNKVEKIVTISAAEVIENHPAFIKVQQTLQNEIEEIQKQMEGMTEEELQSTQIQFQMRSQELQEEAIDTVLEDIQKAAETKGYKYVMDENAILAGGEDVTKEIMEMINSGKNN